MGLSNRPKFIFYTSLTLLMLCIFVPILAYWQTRGDFVPHLAYVQRFVGGDNTVFSEVPNLLYHVMVAVPAKFLPFVSLEIISLIVCTLLYVVLAWFLGQQIYDAITITQPHLHILLAIAVTSALLIVAPLTFFTPNNAYLGYFHSYVYHNPTMMPLRLFAWLLFVMTIHVFGQKSHFVWWRVLLAMLLSFAVILSKPSFTIAFLPAVIVMTFFWLILRKPLDWWTLILGILLPSIGLLGFQALVFKGNGVAWDPFLTFDLWAYHYNPLANQNLLLKLIMSVAFPFVVYVCYFRNASRSVWLNLAWLCALAGIAQAYLFIDTGEPPAGNLTWNAQIGVFVLQMASTIQAIRYTQHKFSWRVALVWGLFLCNVLGGILWYAYHINATYPDIVYRVW